MQDELLMKIKVKCEEPVSVTGTNRKIVMIPFTGEAEGDLFHGHVIGTGVDTQKIDGENKAFLSARYMLEGQDAAGNTCRVFVENQGFWGENFTPSIVTDSPLLAGWESAELYATADGIPGGVMISIFSKGEK